LGWKTDFKKHALKLLHNLRKVRRLIQTCILRGEEEREREGEKELQEAGPH
jgi:hypothetical protein